MKLFYISLIVLVVGCTTEPKVNNTFEPVQVIFDSDMGPDYDDVGAIAVLHALAAKGECEILACCASDAHPSIAPTISVFNTYFGKNSIPIGVAVDSAPDFTKGNHWNDSVISKFLPESMIDEPYPSAVAVYRKVLSAQPDNSVVIVTVGFLSNLAALLKSNPDEFSSLKGVDLVKKKVKRLVSMAGGFPEGREFNVRKDPEASYYLFKNWPTPILFSGFEIGKPIFTGHKIANGDTCKNPVAWAYQYNSKTYGNKISEKRNSWDQTAVLCAVRDPEKYFYVNGPGKFVIHEDGRNEWNPNENASHYFLVHKYPYQHIADVLDDLMIFEP
ncbi:nucleoside hydrolase [Sunxiuqinia sp. A32]|uniref:nucleoside hydrolase n=1 Tax=Sunxiuqinia sp. A32 TaxID=3461496 RepID=UPI0040468547